MKIKFGLSQLKVPAPILYKRFVNALIIVIIPATATLFMGLPVDWMTDAVKIWVGLVSSYTIAILKGLEYLLGVEPPEDEEIETPK